MYKKLLTSFICILFVAAAQSFSYEKFDGKYNYNQYNNNKIPIISQENDSEVLFIVDYSSSMNGQLGHKSKIEVAIDAIKETLSQTGDRTKIGLRIFGITDKPIIEKVNKYYQYNRTNLCTASYLVLPVARYNNENISDRLSKYTPYGVTPIGYSLRQAVQSDFSQDAKLKHIILVTDGGENCGDDPCTYIKNLMELREDFKIDVIGITIEENAYSQLKCIAESGRGKFHDVKTAEEFKQKVKDCINAPQGPKKSNSRPLSEKKNTGIIYKNYIYEFTE